MISLHSRLPAILGTLLTLAAIALPSAAAAASNRLKGHPVPYLALHGDDPVHWREWGPEVMAEARRTNRIVLLSIGYFSCHWCHVMQRESFQDPEIAAFANRHYLFVKIDKEMNPLLDDAMMSFARATAGRGGWPLNVFVIPDGSPIHALLYLPPEQFLEVLTRIQSVWETDADRLRELVGRLPWDEETEADEMPDAAELQRLLLSARQQVLERADFFQGGFGSQSKFPSAPQIAYLLAAHEVRPSEETGDFLVTTLDAMATLGLWDHLAGGFFRYTIDPGWEIPHFEKMLYDNASLADLYLDAERILEREDYGRVARRTLDFMRRDMWRDGALVSSLSAVDGNDVEGGAYLWHADELRQLLIDEEFETADAAWQVSRPPELAAGNHLRRVRSIDEIASRLDRDSLAVAETLARVKDKLLAARSSRVIPVDDKLVSGWNGLALVAFTKAARRYPDGGYAATARNLYEFLTTRAMSHSAEGVTLSRAVVAGRGRGEGALEDYAYVARGLYEWARHTDDTGTLELAADVARAGWSIGFDGSGWRRSPELVRSIPDKVAVVEDGPTRSPSASLLLTSLLLAKQLEDEDWMRELEDRIPLGLARVSASPYWYAGQLLTLLTAAAPALRRDP